MVSNSWSRFHTCTCWIWWMGHTLSSLIRAGSRRRRQLLEFPASRSEKTPNGQLRLPKEQTSWYRIPQTCQRELETLGGPLLRGAPKDGMVVPVNALPTLYWLDGEPTR